MKQKTTIQSTTTTIPSVNYHILQQCNMKCEHCHSVNLPIKHLAVEDSMKIIQQLAEVGFEKINFAGGEPLLYPKLDVLIQEAKAYAMTTSIVTNGSKITNKWLRGAHGCLDWIALSIDSVNPETNKTIGRTTSSGPMTADEYLRIMELIKSNNIRLKINTTVTARNHHEDMSELIIAAIPERWKVMQVLKVNGQNDQSAEKFQITTKQFNAFVDRHLPVEENGIDLIPENNIMMTGSYAMIDPEGRFFDNVDGTHTYSQPILKVGVSDALKTVRIDPNKFEKRRGRYAWK